MTYNDTEGNQFSTEHIRVLVSIASCQIMEHLQPKYGNHLVIVLSSILLILYRPNVSNKLYNGTEEDQFSVQHRRRTGKCCLVYYCVSSCRSCGLNRVIPW